MVEAAVYDDDLTISEFSGGGKVYRFWEDDFFEFPREVKQAMRESTVTRWYEGDKVCFLVSPKWQPYFDAYAK